MWPEVAVVGAVVVAMTCVVVVAEFVVVCADLSRGGCGVC